MKLGHGFSILEAVKAKRGCESFGQLFERVELDGLTVDLQRILDDLDFAELQDQSLSHGFGAIHLVVFAGFAESDLDDVS